MISLGRIEFSFSLVLLGLLAQPAAAQAPRPWQVFSLEGGVRLATAGSGLSFLCARNVPMIALNLQPPASRNPAPVVVTVDGTAYSLAVQQDRAAGVWAGPVGDGALLDAVVSGQVADVAVEGVQRARIALQGAGPVVREALAACWKPAAQASALADRAQPAAPTGASSAPEVPPAQRTAIMRAAGFTQRGSEWVTCDGDDTGMIDAVRDLDGDGRLEAVVGSYGSSCNGNTGQGFVLLTQQGSAWRKLYESIGIPQFFKRDGIAWPDVEIGGAGSDCFRFIRWDGRQYVDGGTSLEGRFCTIEERFEPNLARARTLATGSADFGFAGRVPIRLGYYVTEGERCEAPGSVIRFERDRYTESFASGREIESHLTVVSEIIGPDEDGWLSLLPAESADEADSGLLIKPVFPGTIEVTIQDSVTMNHCDEAQIPARLRR